MQDHQASRTALAVAYIRAAHQILDRQPLLFADPLALKLLGQDSEDAIHGMIERHQNPYGRGLRSHVCLRSRVAEDHLCEQAKAGARWYILLGAGMDTFAYRQPGWARSLRIVEIDHPATQAAKRRMLEAADITPPGNLIFAPVDFSRDTLAQALGRLGIAPSDGVVFSWLGVTMYLTEETISRALQDMAQASSRVSVTLTFRQPPDPSYPGEMQIDDMVAALGEPFVSTFTPEAMAQVLTERGFRSLDFLTPEKAAARYYTPLHEGLPAPRRTTILCASTALPQQAQLLP